jgi:sec-independent protein translocase protein TatC
MKEMSFTEHLEELRTRMIHVVIILGVAFIVCYGLGDVISDALLAPLRAALGKTGKVVYLGLLDKVLSQFQVAFWSSVILSSPLWFREVWLFLRPALYAKEQKVIMPFMLAGFFFFVAGISFGYFIVFPFTFETLMGFGVQNIDATISLKEYLLLTSKVLVFLGLLFQLPNVMLILGFMEIVTKQYLKSIRNYVYVGFAIVSAIMTPPDVITMMALWLPLAALYELGIWAVALIVHPYLKKKYLPEE